MRIFSKWEIETCERKKKYRTEDYALDKAKEIKDREKLKVRVYRCQVCSNWHLTKSPPIKIVQGTPNQKNKIREHKFIQREAEHWEKFFNTND